MDWKYEFWKKNGSYKLVHVVHKAKRADAGELFSHQNVKQMHLEGDAKVQVKEYLDDEQISMTEFNYGDYYKLRNDRINKTISDFNVNLKQLKKL
jgi:predicted RNA-binding protein with PUA-like domain